MRFAILFVMFLFTNASYAMNDVCQGEFAPIIQRHTGVMQSSKNLPKSKPKTYEQALANSNAHCAFFTRAQSSFATVQAWMKKNKDFCQVPDDQLKIVTQSLGNMSNNKAASCNAVGQLKQQKSKADKQMALMQAQQAQAQNPFAKVGSTARANDPFNPVISRKPQLTLE